jgi:hypothetical protein
LAFVGFTDAGRSITSVTINAGTNAWDAIGVDDVQYQSANTVPEPASIALLLTGCFFRADVLVSAATAGAGLKARRSVGRSQSRDSANRGLFALDLAVELQTYNPNLVSSRSWIPSRIYLVALRRH